jgi:exosortase
MEATDSAEASETRSGQTARWLPFACVGLIGAATAFAYRGLLAYDPLAETKGHIDGVEAFFFSPTDSNPTLIFALMGLFLFTRRHRLLVSVTGRSSFPLALPLLAAASALCVWAHYVRAPELLVPSLSLMLLGAGALWGGRAGARSLLVPAAFLMLAYRPPGLWINQIIYWLQGLVVHSTDMILRGIGIESQTSGDMILAMDRVFHVIETCAGLRSIETMLMTAVVYGEIMGCTRLRAGLLIVLAPFVGMLSNQIRVLSLVFNPYSSLASVHTLQGLVMIVAGVLMLAALDALFRRLLPGDRSPRPSERVSARRVPKLLAHGRLRFASQWLLLVALGLANSAIGTWDPASVTLPRLSSFPPSFAGWQASGRPLDKEFVGSVGYSEWVNRRYRKGDGEVFLFMASDDRLEPRVSLLSPKNELLGGGWQIAHSAEIAQLGLARGVSASVQVTRAHPASFLVFYWYEDVASLPSEALRSALVLDRGSLRRPQRAVVLRASTQITAAGLGEALRTLDEFLALSEEPLARILAPPS